MWEVRLKLRPALYLGIVYKRDRKRKKRQTDKARIKETGTVLYLYSQPNYLISYRILSIWTTKRV